MSTNTLLNGVIALVEGRTEIAKEMLRSQEVRVSSTEVQLRLAKALQDRETKAIIDAMRKVLQLSLRANPDTAAENEGIKWDTSNSIQEECHYIHDQAFYEGVCFVEKLLEEYIEGLTT